jgi:hypothetical protein
LELPQGKFASALLLGLWIYCLILWAYIVIDSFLFPPFQYMSISTLIPIKENLIADVAFPISFVSFVLWVYSRDKRAS